LIGCGLLVLLLLAVEAGVRAGTRARAQRKGEGTADLGTIQGAVLGLLGLLLAFTYSLAAGRQDARRGLLVREANAIGTAYLRAGLLPEPRRGELRAILRQYVDSRIAPDDVVRDPVRLAEAVQRSERVLQTLWPAAPKYFLRVDVHTDDRRAQVVAIWAIMRPRRFSEGYLRCW
jgi:hypothetical protein